MARELPEKIDLKALDASKERNRIDRLNFIDFQVKWQQSHPKKWSKEQNKVINWQME